MSQSGPYAEAKAAAVLAFDVAFCRDVLTRAGGKVSAAARLAHLERSNFRRLLKSVIERGGKIPYTP